MATHSTAPELDAAFSLAYEELRRTAVRVKGEYPGATQSPSTLVNEAWLKLRRSPALADTSPLHFRRIAARAMRQVMIEAARRRSAVRRGSGKPAVTLDEQVNISVDTDDAAIRLLEVDAALTRLAAIHPRPAEVVERRFFGGMEVREVAESLDISEATVLRDWRLARAWLAREMAR